MYQFNSSVLKRRVLFQFIFEAKETLLWVAGYGRARGGGGVWVVQHQSKVAPDWLARENNKTFFPEKNIVM